MKTPTIGKVVSLIAAAALALSLAACSDSGDGGEPKSEASAAGQLSKSQFVAKMNSVCKKINTERNSLQYPSAPTDFDLVKEYFSRTLALYISYNTQAKALIAQSPDSEQLNAKWIEVEDADFEVVRPTIEKIIDAAARQDSAAISAEVNKLGGLPDHSDTIATFMTGYGLTECAELETT